MSAVNVSIASGAIIACIFDPGSQAIGCFINLTNVANGITRDLKILMTSSFLNQSYIEPADAGSDTA